jgi:hypothetical protein
LDHRRRDRGGASHTRALGIPRPQRGSSGGQYRMDFVPGCRLPSGAEPPRCLLRTSGSARLRRAGRPDPRRAGSAVLCGALRALATAVRPRGGVDPSRRGRGGRGEPAGQDLGLRDPRRLHRGHPVRRRPRPVPPTAGGRVATGIPPRRARPPPAPRQPAFAARRDRPVRRGRPLAERALSGVVSTVAPAARATQRGDGHSRPASREAGGGGGVPERRRARARGSSGWVCKPKPRRPGDCSPAPVSGMD